MRGDARSSVVMLAPMLAMLALARPARADEKQACLTANEDAQKLRDEHKLTKAREQLMACSRDVCPGVIRKDCAQWLQEVEASLPSVVLSVRSSAGADIVDATVTLDGQPLAGALDGRAIALDPGPHAFHFEVAGQPPIDQQVVVREGERNRSIAVTVGGQAAASVSSPPAATSTDAPAPSPTKSGISPVAYVAGGVAVVALGSFAFFGLSGKGDVSTLRDGCGQTRSCSQDDVDSAKSKLLIADISLGVGLVAAGVATYFFITGASTPSSVKVGGLRDVRVSAAPVQGGGAALLGGRF